MNPEYIPITMVEDDQGEGVKDPIDFPVEDALTQAKLEELRVRELRLRSMHLERNFHNGGRIHD